MKLSPYLLTILCLTSASALGETFQGKEYEWVKTRYTQSEAQSYAEDEGGHLVVINSQAENDFIFDLIQSDTSTNLGQASDGGGISYVWLGADDATQEGTWRWVNGDAWSYTNWGVQEPDDYLGQDGLAMGLENWPSGAGNSSAYGLAGEWNDISRSNQLTFIIEYPASSGDSGSSDDGGSSGSSGSGTQDEESVANCDASYVTLDDTTIVVTATGSDDTSNIQCALDAAVSGGLPVVKLDKGTFYASNVTVKNFKGTFQGVTKASTELIALDGAFQCPSSDDEEKEYPSASLLAFQLGEPQVKFMTIKADQPCPPAGGEGGSRNFSLIKFGNDWEDCDKRVSFSKVDRVIFEGNSFGQDETIVRGVRIFAECKAGADSYKPLLGKSMINRSDFIGLTTGIQTTMGAKAQVDITFNTFSDTGFGVYLSGANQISNVVSNTFNSDNGRQYSYRVSIFQLDDQSSNRTVIDANTFNIENVRESGGDVFDDSVITPAFWVLRAASDSKASVLISNNRFNIESPDFVTIMIEDTNSGVISGNTFVGTLASDQGSDPRSFVLSTSNRYFSDNIDGWTVVDNNFSGLTPCGGYLNSQTTNMIFGPNQGCSIIDGGSSNYFLDQLEPTSPE